MTLSTATPQARIHYETMGCRFNESPNGEYVLWTSEAQKNVGKDYDWDGVFDCGSDLFNFVLSHRFVGNTEELRAYEESYESTGYVKPNYWKFNPENHYSQVLEILGIEEGSDLTVEKLIQLESYNQYLNKQLQRQFQYLEAMNEKIVSILKVLIYEVNTSVDKYSDDESKTKAMVATFNELHWFYKDQIIGLESAEDIVRSFDRIISPWADMMSGIQSYIHRGINYLSEERQTVISFTNMILGKAEAVESILEDSYLNDRIKSAKEFELNKRIKGLPSPKEVAHQFYYKRENKRRKFNVEVIASVMSVTRDYIVKNNITDIYGHVSAIIKICKEVDASKNAMNKWINTYAKKAGRKGGSNTPSKQ